MYNIYFIDAKNFMFYYSHLFTDYEYVSFSEDVRKNVLMEVDNLTSLINSLKIIKKDFTKYIIDCHKYKKWFINVKNRNKIENLGKVNNIVKSYEWLLYNKNDLEIDCEEKGEYLCFIFL